MKLVCIKKTYKLYCYLYFRYEKEMADHKITLKVNNDTEMKLTVEDLDSDLKSSKWNNENTQSYIGKEILPGQTEIFKFSGYWSAEGIMTLRTELNGRVNNPINIYVCNPFSSSDNLLGIDVDSELAKKNAKAYKNLNEDILLKIVSNSDYVFSATVTNCNGENNRANVDLKQFEKKKP